MARLADTLAEAEAELPADISRYLEADTLVDTLQYKTSIGKSSDTLQQTLRCQIRCTGDAAFSVKWWRPLSNGK